MAQCNGTSQLYCAPGDGDTLAPNTTHSLEYNAQFPFISTEQTVDMYLYHADDSSLATLLPNLPNSGEMPFTIDKVNLTPRGETNNIGMVYCSTNNNFS